LIKVNDQGHAVAYQRLSPVEARMTKRLSEQLSDLSACAKKGRSCFGRRRKRSARQDHGAQRAGAFCRNDGDRKGQPENPACRRVDSTRSNVPSNRADRLEREAGFAIEYAIAAVEQVGLAVLDAIDGRLAAEKARQK
jgi:hypothetical protein